MPTLIVQGERDPYIPRSQVTRLQQDIEDATLVLVPDGGHFLPIDTPARVADEIQTFLGQRSAPMIDWKKRAERAATSLLENESLTADLDDRAAQALLDWGIACVKGIAQSATALLDADAEQNVVQRFRATRRMMRAVNRWIAKQATMDAESKARSWAKIVEQAAIAYGPDFRLPDGDPGDRFLSQSAELGDDPVQLIAKLRTLIEHPDSP